MSLIAEREVKFADIEAGFHDKLARLPKQIAAAQHLVSMRAQAAQRFQLMAACLPAQAQRDGERRPQGPRSSSSSCSAAPRRAPADDLPPPPRAVQRLTSEPVVKGGTPTDEFYHRTSTHIHT